MIKTTVLSQSYHQSFVKLASLISVGVGSIVLLGWLFDITMFKSVFPGLANMKVNTALLFVLSGIALWYLCDEKVTPRARLVAKFCVSVILIICFITLTEYLLGRNPGIDQLLFQDVTAIETSHPGRMAPTTAMNFIFIGIALLFLDTNSRLTDFLCILSILLSYLSLLGYIFSLQSIYYYHGFTVMALHTALTFIALSLGILSARPGVGIMNVISSNLSGGKMWRRMSPAILLIPLIFGGFVARFVTLNFLGFDSDTPIIVSSSTITFLVILWFNARSLNESETKNLYVNRLYALLSDINQAIVRIHDIQQLFEKACTVAVEQGAFKMTWIGKLNNETQHVDIVASAGYTGNYLKGINIDLTDKERRGGPIGRAILTGVYVIVSDIEHDETMQPWRENALLHGYKSSAIFPIIVFGKVWGVFSFYAPKVYFFSEEEIKLLDKVVAEISNTIEVTQKEEEHTKSKHLLEANEKQFKEAQRIAKIGYWIVELNDQTVKWSEEMYNIFRVGEKEFPQTIESFLKLIYPEDAHLMEQWIRETIGKRTPKELVFRIVTPEGLRYILGDGVLITDEAGLPERMFGTAKDVTEQKLAEEKVVASETRYRRLFEAARDGILILDAETGMIVDANPFLIDLLGYTRENFLGRAIWDVGFLKDIISNIDKFHELQEKGYVRYANLPLEAVDGRKLEVEFISNVYLVNNEKVIQCNIRDNTARKKAEDKLIIFQNLINQSNDAIELLDIETGRFLDVNEKGYLGLGYTREEFLALSVYDIDPMVTKSIFRTIGEDLRKTGVKMWEGAHRRKDGSTFPVEVNLKYIRLDREYMITVVRDITERRKTQEKQKSLESQLQQAQKLESLGTLASGIAHDFNNILSIIIGHASLLERLPADPVTNKKNATAITKAGLRGAALVKQLLTFARKSDIRVESVRLNDIALEISTLIVETFPKTISISLHLEQNLPSIVADAVQVHQVLLNLCVNARDAMPDGGTLTISTFIKQGDLMRLQYQNATAKEYICLRLSDTGMGMDEETRLRIFEPFFTTKGIGMGTGLGLSMVFGIVEGHNGFIDVQSELGKGTAFEVFFPLPLQLLELEEPKDTIRKEVPGGSETILLVEDEEMLRELVKVILKAKGYNVLTATDGEEGVETYTQHQKEIQLVVSDFGLPKLSGFEAFKRIKAINPSVKFIVASGFIEPEMKTVMLSAGIKDVIQKPYSAEKMLLSIRSILDLK